MLYFSCVYLDCSIYIAPIRQSYRFVWSVTTYIRRGNPVVSRYSHRLLRAVRSQGSPHHHHHHHQRHRRHRSNHRRWPQVAMILSFSSLFMSPTFPIICCGVQTKLPSRHRVDGVEARLNATTRAPVMDCLPADWSDHLAPSRSA